MSFAIPEVQDIMFLLVTFVSLFVYVEAQFGGPIQLSSLSTQNGTAGCGGSVSCLPAPWCRRSVDKNGCSKCVCSLGGFGSALAGKSGVMGSSIHRSMNPATSMFSSGMNGFPGFPSFNGQSSMMNPMAGMFQKLGMGMFGNPMGGGGFNSLTGPTGIGTGVLPNSNQPVPTSGKSCDPAPYTCSLPPPWCQRTIDNNGCVVCMCGEALQTYLQELEAGKTTEPSRTSTNSHISSTPPTTGTTTHHLTTTSCLQSFFCTKTCANGYMTDESGCPLCRCIETGSSGILTTRPPITQATTTPLPPTTGSQNGLIMCPGIFDCTLMCINGYVNDDRGCPMCKCMGTT